MVQRGDPDTHSHIPNSPAVNPVPGPSHTQLSLQILSFGSGPHSFHRLGIVNIFPRAIL